MKTFNLKLFLIIIMIAMIINQKTVQAATYNFYFNNTEQGDNSTATPNLKINDSREEEVKKDDDGSLVTNKTQLLDSPAKNEVNKENNNKNENEELSFYKKNKYRLNFGYFTANAERKEKIYVYDGYWQGWSNELQKYKRSPKGVILGVNYYLNNYLNLGLSVGGFNRLELELNPGNYSNNNFFEIGFLAGLSTPVYLDSDVLFKPHIGFRSAIKFSKQVSLHIGFRTDIFPESDTLDWYGYGFKQFDFGIAIHI